jgi:hypothetical protein
LPAVVLGEVIEGDTHSKKYNEINVLMESHGRLVEAP